MPGLGRRPAVRPAAPAVCPRRTCAPHAAATRPSPPWPPFPAVSSSLDTETPEPSLGGEEELGLHWVSPWTSMPLATLQSRSPRPGCRKETGQGRGQGLDWRSLGGGRGKGRSESRCREGDTWLILQSIASVGQGRLQPLRPCDWKAC